MAGAVFERGPISFEVVKPVTKRRLVKLGEKGVEHAGAADDVFGATVTDGIPKGTRNGANDLTIGPESTVAVHISPAVVKLEFTGEASTFKLGTKVSAADDGKVAATGSKQVGVVVRPPVGKFVTVALTVPA